MRRCLLLFVRMLVLMALSGAPLLARAATITILHVNDTHSHLDAVGPKDDHLDGTLGGLAKAATVIGTLKATEPNPLFLHAGDLFQGDIYFNATLGVAELQALAGLGLDAMAVGNHELVFGTELLLGVLSQSFPPGQPPLLSANLLGVSLPGFDAFVQPNAIKTVGGVNVGIFGMTVRDYIVRLETGENLVDDPVALAGIATEQAAQLRSQGAQVVVCLSHLGFAMDQKVAAGSSGLDAIVGGHDHLLLAEPAFVTDQDGKAVPIVQAGEFYEHVGKLRLDVENGSVAFAGYEVVPVDAAVPRAPAMSALVENVQGLVAQRFSALVGDMFHTRVAIALHDITRVFDPRFKDRDTGLGNLVTDAYRQRTGTEVALTVNGVVEDRVAGGGVVGDDLFRVLSDGADPSLGLPEFPGLGFPLFTFEISGAELLKAIELGVGLGGDFFPQVSGMRFTFDSSRPAGQRVKNVRIGDDLLDPGRTYTATTNFEVLAGLPQLGVQLTNVQPVVRFLDQQVVPEYEYLAVRDWAARIVLLDYGSEGRIRDLAPLSPLSRL